MSTTSFPPLVIQNALPETVTSIPLPDPMKRWPAPTNEVPAPATKGRASRFFPRLRLAYQSQDFVKAANAPGCALPPDEAINGVTVTQPSVSVSVSSQLCSSPEEVAAAVGLEANHNDKDDNNNNKGVKRRPPPLKLNPLVDNDINNTRPIAEHDEDIFRFSDLVMDSPFPRDLSRTNPTPKTKSELTGCRKKKHTGEDMSRLRIKTAGFWGPELGGGRVM